MTNNYPPREDAVIDQTAARWSGQGYTLLRRPSRSQLPDFLRPYEPDALAVGREPQLVIAVVRDDGVGGERVRRLQQALEDHADWRLELLYDRDDRPATLPAASLDEIAGAIARIRALTDTPDRNAALLMASASLEALARMLEPTVVDRPQTPDRVIEVLTSLGYLVQSEADRLRRLAATRNALVHGQLGVEVGADDLHEFADVLDGLREVAGKRATDR